MTDRFRWTLLWGVLICFSSAGSISADNAENTSTADAGKSGTFAGTIKFKGQPPALPPLAANNPKAAVCGKPIPDESLVVNANGIANVFVYMIKAPAGAAAAKPPAQKIVFDQKNCRFKPHAFFLQTNQQIQMINSDNFAHNIHTYPIRNDAMNQVLQGNNRVGFTTSFPKSEILPHQIGCDIHTWMSAWVLILDHPYAAVTDDKGRFKIEGLPPGEYEFRIWHEKAGYLEKKYQVKITAGQSTEQALNYAKEVFEE